MSDKLGTLALGRRAHNPFLGRDYNDERNYSEDVARQIDEEVRDIVDKSHRRATDILLEHRGQLDAVVQALLEHETLNREEFLQVMAGEVLAKREITPDHPDSGAAVEEKEADKSRKPNVAPPRLEPGPA
jgi:cell division protease FtsH